ncbi:hypothetical protein FQR65_LT17157 [Abscondita terminalis]|nr:hypothetical protein FQR65_LT17157 [Abscondita terminalis]
MHRLVDLVHKYSHIVESKKTDSVAWKEKVMIWDNISNEFNSSVTESKSVEQLRTKYDNLKKETRRYYAKQRQLLYRTGGGIIEDDLRDILKNLYTKIKAIINFSVQGLQPQGGDSDLIAQESDAVMIIDTQVLHEEAEHVPEFVIDSVPIVAESKKNNTAISDDENIESTVDVDVTPGTSAMNILKRKKHTVLTREKNKKKTNNEILKDVTSSKSDLNKLKQELLIKENQRNEELHKERLEGLRLDNEQKRLKIKLLTMELENYKKKSSSN